MNPENPNPSQSTEEATPVVASKNNSGSGFWTDIIKFTIFALVVVLPIRFFVAQPFIVSGASMDPTFATGQYLIVDQLTYHFEKPERGQVIIFKYPKDESKYFIKRIIGLPGETVKISGSAVTIVNKAHPEGFVLSEPYVSPENIADNNMSVTLKDNEYWVMGDNRHASSDSRAWGTLPGNLIVGTPFLRLFPFDKVSALPGNFKESK